MAKRRPGAKTPAIGTGPKGPIAKLGIVTPSIIDNVPPHFEAHVWHARIEDGVVAMFFDQWHGNQPGRRLEARLPFSMVPILMKTFDSGFGRDIAQYVIEHPITAQPPSPRAALPFPVHDVVRVHAMRLLRTQNDAEAYLFSFSPIQAFDRVHESMSRRQELTPVTLTPILRVGGTVGAMATLVAGLVSVARELAEMEQREATMTERKAE